MGRSPSLRLKDSWDRRDSIARPASEIAWSLMGSESYLSDFHSEPAVKLRMPSSFTCNDYVNAVSGMVSKGLENKEESKSNALEFGKLVEAQELFIKEEHKDVEEEAPRIFAEEEQDDFPELSFLRGDCMMNSSNIGIGAEVEYMSRMFNDGRDSDCESSFLASLRVNDDCSLVDVDADLCKRGDGFFCPPLPSECTVASVISNGSSIEGRKRIVPNLESFKSNFDSCSDNATNLDDKTKDDNLLFSVQNGLGLPLQYARKLKEVHHVNNFASSLEINTSHKKVEENILGVGHVDHEASCSAQGSTGEPTYCSATERSTSEKLSFGELDIKENTFDCFKRTSTCCSIDNDCCTEEENVPGVIANSCSITSVRRSNPKRGASLRSNLSDGKYNPPIRIQSDRRKCRRKFGSSTSCTSTTLKMFTGVKRQMRNSHRKARLSIWGTVESLFTIIKQRDELINHDSVPNPARKSRSKKSGCGVNQRKMIAAMKNKLSQISSTKLLLSRQSIHPRMLDAQCSLENGIENFMTTSDFHASSGTSSTKVELEQNLAEQWHAVVRSNMKEGQQREKDLESTLTQETSADNLLSESQGVSSCVDFESVAETVGNKNLSDPGNSPDSDVYNPLIDVGNLTFEDYTFIKKEFASIKNNRVQESKDEDGLPSAPPKPFVVRLPFLTKQMQSSETPRSPKKSHKGKKKLKQKKEKKEKLENKWKREKIGNKTCQISECPFLLSDPPGEGSLDCQAKSNEVKKASLSCSCTLKGKGACNIGSKCSKISKKHCKIGSNPDAFLINSSVSGLADLDKFNHCLKIQNRTKASKCTLQKEGNEQLEAILPSGYDKECQVRESAKMGLRKSKSNHADSTRHRRKFIFGHQKENIMKSDELRKADGFPNENDHLDFSPGTTNNVSPLGGETTAVDALLKNATEDVATPIFSDSARETFNICMDQSSFSGKKAWALCDDCQKWRCVPDELVHVIEKDRWTCKDNVDGAFADCTIPQEKTDEEINNDLGILDEQYCSTALHNYGEPAPPKLSAKTQTAWIRIKSNLFLHRNRRTQTIDEIMVCHCKPPPYGGLGCGEECLNRMLNIECVKGTCPCGNLCSNQQFQKRKYAKFKWLKCGKKGFGLQLEDNVSKGEFLIEYVGEVLDLAAYEARLRNYACRGQKHFYFMTLNGGEVIDACDKGNLGRFINHSCDPNCRTEKWMVNGEVCIGLFAIRDIKKGEEITFDYNYVRVFGAAAKKCVCGSAECRGYIGGDPSSSEVIVQDDSDTDDLEPVVIEDGEIELGVMEINSVSTGAKVANYEIFSVKRNETQENPCMSEQGTREENNGLEDQVVIHQLSSELDRTDSLMQSSCVDIKSNMCKISDIQSFQEGKLGLSSIEPVQNFHEEVNEGPPLSTFNRSLPAGKLSERPEHSLNYLPQTDHTLHGPNLEVATKVSSQNSGSLIHRSSATCPSEEIQSASKSNNVVKAVRHIKVKRSRVSIRSAVSGKTKKLSTAITSRHIEGVEEKLNELLDEDGGIYRKKDAAKRYLKLLLVTAVAGDGTKGSMSQSARDLSMILDAILKTKSRSVLVDIINKNGLQMLHNMLKQNCDNFNSIPILRKLLKVLEFLAEKEILTRDQINAAAPCSGMESFKESMLKLMKHQDAQVQHIARTFAEKWITRTSQRVDPSDRDDRQLCPNYSRSNWCRPAKLISWHDHDKINATNCQPSSVMRGEALSYPSQAVSSSTSFTEITPMEIVGSRKRKSRWDQPSDANEQASDCLEEQVMLCSSSSSIKYMRPSPLEPISDIEVPKQKSPTRSDGNNSFAELICDDNNDDDEMPPGFGSCKDDLPIASASTDINGEAVVIGHLQERYLAHLTVSYGMPITLMQQQETTDPSLKVAPAMPFKPFPPLPSYPRQGPNPSYATNRPFINGNTNYRQARQRAGFPKYGNPRRFFQPQQLNHHRPQRFWPM